MKLRRTLTWMLFGFALLFVACPTAILSLCGFTCVDPQTGEPVPLGLQCPPGGGGGPTEPAEQAPEEGEPPDDRPPKDPQGGGGN